MDARIRLQMALPCVQSYASLTIHETPGGGSSPAAGRARGCPPAGGPTLRIRSGAPASKRSPPESHRVDTVITNSRDNEEDPTAKVKAFLFAVAALLASPLAQAECAFEGSGSVSILSNDFPALNAVNGAAKECASEALSISANETTEHRDIQVEALKAQPANFNVVICANSSIVPLLNGGLIRPLDDLVAKYGSHLAPSQLVTVPTSSRARNPRSRPSRTSMPPIPQRRRKRASCEGMRPTHASGTAATRNRVREGRSFLPSRPLPRVVVGT